MKVRKKEIKVPKNFSFAPWQIKKSSEEILHFLEAVILDRCGVWIKTLDIRLSIKGLARHVRRSGLRFASLCLFSLSL